MDNNQHPARNAIRLIAIAALTTMPVWVGACASGGGGSSSGVSPLPPAPPPPSPPPPLPPPIAPPASFETTEYNRTRGLPLIKASHAWSRGATGEGIIVAVIDTGAVQDHPDLSGQFVGPTRDMYSGRTPSDIDTGGHGSFVSGIIVAKRDSTGIVGVAFGAKVLDIRADRPGSCAETGEDEGCSFPSSTVANAINYAVNNGAKIINLSLGSTPDTNQTIENAIISAAQRGVLVVISAGNDAEPPGTDEFGNPISATGTTPNSPARAAGYTNNLGRVVAVGSIVAAPPTGISDTSQVGKISTFSNRAGSAASHAYILAPGQRVVSTGPDDDVVFPGQSGNDADSIGDYYVVSGTSFAAPYVSGSLALLLQTFPNLQARPQDALRILLDTADDYVDLNPDPILGIPAGVGIDNVSGVGVLNLQRAFEPQGVPTAQINGEIVLLSELVGTASGAFGDWAEVGGLYGGMSMLDRYERVFAFNGAALSRPAAAPLTNMDARASSFAGESRGMRTGNLDFTWHTPKLHEDRSAPYQQEPQSQFAATLRFTGGEVSAGRGGSLPRIAPSASLVAEPGMPDAFSLSGSWASVTHELGPVDVHAFTASDDRFSRFGAGIGRTGSGWSVRTGIESIEDGSTTLGGTVQSRLGFDNQGSLTAWMTEARRDFANGWSIAGGYEAGFAELGGVDARDVQTSRWSIGAEKFLGSATLGFTLAQPRRAEQGTLFYSTVTGADTEGLIISDRQIALTPSGRQLNFQTQLRWNLNDNWTAETAAAYIHQPNHVASADEAGMVWFAIRGRY